MLLTFPCLQYLQWRWGPNPGSDWHWRLWYRHIHAVGLHSIPVVVIICYEGVERFWCVYFSSVDCGRNGMLKTLTSGPHSTMALLIHFQNLHPPPISAFYELFWLKFGRGYMLFTIPSKSTRGHHAKTYYIRSLLFSYKYNLLFVYSAASY